MLSRTTWPWATSTLSRTSRNGVVVWTPAECEVGVNVEDDAIRSSHETSPRVRALKCVVYTNVGTISSAVSADTSDDIVGFDVATSDVSLALSETSFAIRSNSQALELR